MNYADFINALSAFSESRVNYIVTSVDTGVSAYASRLDELYNEFVETEASKVYAFLQKHDFEDPDGIMRAVCDYIVDKFCREQTVLDNKSQICKHLVQKVYEIAISYNEREDTKIVFSFDKLVNVRAKNE